MSVRTKCDTVLIRHDGMTDFGRLMGWSFIAVDGEASEGQRSTVLKLAAL